MYNYFQSFYKKAEDDPDSNEEEYNVEVAHKQPDFNTLKQYEETTTANASDILYHLLNALFEEKYSLI